MADIFINLGDVLNDDDLGDLKARLKTLRAGDEITIRMEASDAHQADRIIDKLREQGFDYQPHGGHPGEYFIIAKKKA